jgi:hypothetical protein
MRKISTTTIIEMCNIYDCNQTVAQILKCPVSVVKAHRPFIEPKKDARTRVENRPAQSGSQAQFSRLKSEEEKMTISSRLLLVRQLEVGQHWLKPDRFKEVVTSIGMADRLPKSMRA